MRIEIDIPGNPPTATAQQKGEKVIRGRVHHYEKANVRLAKQEIAYKIKKYAPAQPLIGPIHLMIEWAFELKKQKKPEWKITRPDLDNLEKGLLDVMTDLGFWNDDAQVAVKQTCKKAVPVGKGCLKIVIEEIGNE